MQSVTQGKGQGYQEIFRSQSFVNYCLGVCPSTVWKVLSHICLATLLVSNSKLHIYL